MHFFFVSTRKFKKTYQYTDKLVSLMIDCRFLFSKLTSAPGSPICLCTYWSKYCGIIKIDGRWILVVFVGSPLPWIYIPNENRFWKNKVPYWNWKTETEKEDNSHPIDAFFLVSFLAEHISQYILQKSTCYLFWWKRSIQIWAAFFVLVSATAILKFITVKLKNGFYLIELEEKCLCFVRMTALIYQLCNSVSALFDL